MNKHEKNLALGASEKSRKMLWTEENLVTKNEKNKKKCFLYKINCGHRNSFKMK